MATETLTHGALPRLQWSPVITGVLCALAAQIVLGLFGVAFGFAAASAGRALGVLADVWGLVTPLVASCIGAHVAVRMTGEQRDASVYLHGAVVWCIGLIAGAIFINTGKSAVEVTGAAGVAALLGLGGALLGAATGKRAMSTWGQRRAPWRETGAGYGLREDTVPESGVAYGESGGRVTTRPPAGMSGMDPLDPSADDPTLHH